MSNGTDRNKETRNRYTAVSYTHLVGSVNSILSVKKIVEAIEEPVIVVVSALGGITDKLLATSSMAAKGDVGYEREFSEIITRHLDAVSYTHLDVYKRQSVVYIIQYPAA